MTISSAGVLASYYGPLVHGVAANAGRIARPGLIFAGWMALLIAQ